MLIASKHFRGRFGSVRLNGAVRRGAARCERRCVRCYNMLSVQSVIKKKFMSDGTGKLTVRPNSHVCDLLALPLILSSLRLSSQLQRLQFPVFCSALHALKHVNLAVNRSSFTVTDQLARPTHIVTWRSLTIVVTSRSRSRSRLRLRLRSHPISKTPISKHLTRSTVHFTSEPTRP